MQECSRVFFLFLFFPNHRKTDVAWYCLDGILVTGETEQYLKLENHIKLIVHLCFKIEKNKQDTSVCRQL